ncbi:MAG: molybdenum ABC transporter ATP-binding protein, partial [Bacteroidales bacterium]|nr:molybdenum ABC transporter ATP-binding protein [Bacteroidales bacterium]
MTYSQDFGEDSHRLLYENIRYIAFRDMYGDASADNVCYQQRWNHGDQDEEIKTVREALGEADGKDGDTVSDSLLDTLLPLMD